MNAKNTIKKSPIHENADANITCDIGDGDISRSRSRLPHGQTDRRPHRYALLSSTVLRGWLLVRLGGWVERKYGPIICIDKLSRIKEHFEVATYSDQSIRLKNIVELPRRGTAWTGVPNENIEQECAHAMHPSYLKLMSTWHKQRLVS